MLLITFGKVSLVINCSSTSIKTTKTAAYTPQGKGGGTVTNSIRSFLQELVSSSIGVRGHAWSEQSA